MNIKEDNKKRLRFFYGLIIYLLTISSLCQWLVFDNWQERGLSVLIGTCGGLIGGFSALLASPYSSSDSERLSKVGSVVSTLITGYIVAKIVDPLIAVAVMANESKSPLIFQTKNGANVLVAIIGFLSAFLLVYQHRAYIDGEILENEQLKEQLKEQKMVNEQLLKQQTIDEKKTDISHNKPEIVKDNNSAQTKDIK